MIKQPLQGSVAALTLFLSTSLSAATFSVQTTAPGTSDSAGPTSTGTILATSTDPNGFGLDFNGDAVAAAAADETGNTAVFAEGIYADGNLFQLTADSFFSDSFTNSTAAAVNFTYDFVIQGITVEVADFAGVDQSSGLTAEASASVFMSTTGGLSDSTTLSLQLVGGRVAHDITAVGGTPSPFTTSGGLGYTLGSFTGAFSGVLGAGETLSIDTELMALIAGPGFELGARAFIGDPNNLSTTPGLSGSLTVTAIPVPAAVWLMASGLVGLIGFARRGKIRNS